jgi:hypothetical protein
VVKHHFIEFAIFADGFTGRTPTPAALNSSGAF